MLVIPIENRGSKTARHIVWIKTSLQMFVILKKYILNKQQEMLEDTSSMA